jgi:hypothetical protein
MSSPSMSDGLPPPDPSQRDHYEPEPKVERAPEYERLRRVLLAVGGLAMVVFAVALGALVLRGGSDDTQTQGEAGTAPALSQAPPAANPTSIPADSSQTAAPVTTSAAVVPGATTATGEAPTATTAVGTATAAPPADATTTAAPPKTVAPVTTLGNDPSAQAVATAQAFLNALADGRWNDARVLNPGRHESDAFLQTQYGPLENATVIPARMTPEPAGRYDMRFGIVAHESQPTGHQTVLMCSHWQVDVPDHTIVRIASARLRVESGYVDAGALSQELTTTCASLPLK